MIMQLLREVRYWRRVAKTLHEDYERVCGLLAAERRRRVMSDHLPA